MTCAAVHISLIGPSLQVARDFLRLSRGHMTPAMYALSLLVHAVMVAVAGAPKADDPSATGD